MSNFGQYVHYTWANYEKYGTYTDVSQWRRTDGKIKAQSNFNKNIFNVHKRMILTDATPMPNIKQLEDEYNAANLRSFNRVQSLFSEMKRGSLAAKESVQAMLSILRTNWTPQRISSILQNLRIDPKTHNITYVGEGYTGSKLTQSKQYLVKLPIPSGTQRRSCQSLINKINAIENSLQKDLEETEYKLYEPSILHIKEFLSKEQAALNDASNSLKQKKRDLLSPQSSYLAVLYLNDLIEQFETVDEINRLLQSRFAELLGTLAGETIENLMTAEIRDKVLQPLIQEGLTGGKQTESSGSIIKFKAGIDQSALRHFKTTGSEAEKSAVITHKNGRLSIRALGSSVNQKADVEFIFSNQEKIGLSIKNTKYQLLNEDQLLTSKPIQAQSSSLALYLLGAQEQLENLGNHYLNIFSKHYSLSNHSLSESTITHNMRQQAIESLSLAILYSALSGENQLRKGGAAQILAIYDKAKGVTQRVKFFDIGTIVRKAATSHDFSMLTPSIASLSFENKYGTTATARITKTLVKARSTVIQVALSKAFL